MTWSQWVSNGQYGGHMQVHYRYWMTYADMDKYAVSVGDAYDPDVDYEAMAKETKPKESKAANGSKQAW